MHNAKRLTEAIGVVSAIAGILYYWPLFGWQALIAGAGVGFTAWALAESIYLAPNLYHGSG